MSLELYQKPRKYKCHQCGDDFFSHSLVNKRWPLCYPCRFKKADKE